MPYLYRCQQIDNHSSTARPIMHKRSKSFPGRRPILLYILIYLVIELQQYLYFRGTLSRRERRSKRAFIVNARRSGVTTFNDWAGPFEASPQNTCDITRLYSKSARTLKLSEFLFCAHIVIQDGGRTTTRCQDFFMS